MTARQLRRLAVALVVVVLFWGAAEILGRGSDELGGAFTLPALTAADVDTVRITRPADTVVLAKHSATAWTANGYAASPDAITGLFDALTKSAVGEKAAQSAASHARMGVDSAQGKRLRFVKGRAVVAELVVGERGPGWQGAYVRRADSDEVYLVRGELATFAERILDDWRDKRIAEVTPDSVREVRVQLRGRGGRGSYTLRRTNGEWRLASGGVADSAAVQRMLDQYRNLNAGSFPTPAQLDSVDFVRPDRRVTLVGRTGPIVELLFDSTSYWWSVKRTDRETVYRLENWRVDQMLPADSTLRKKSN